MPTVAPAPWHPAAGGPPEVNKRGNLMHAQVINTQHGTFIAREGEIFDAAHMIGGRQVEHVETLTADQFRQRADELEESTTHVWTMLRGGRDGVGIYRITDKTSEEVARANR